jgi:phage tail-like protein
MPVVGFARTYDRKFSFQLQIAGFDHSGWMKASALEVEIAEIKHYEGGTLIPNKSPGRMEYKDLTLERGAVKNDYDCFNWFAGVGSGVQNVGLSDQFIKRPAFLRQMDRAGIYTRVWALYGCWPKQFTAGEWDNTVDEQVIEKLVLAYDFFVPLPV